MVGTMNNPGTILMTISDLGSMDADLAVDETDLPRLKVGQSASLTIEAFVDRTFPGVVREVGSSPIRPGSDAAVRTGTTTTEAIDFEVKVTVADPPGEIRPGFSVTAEIETGRANGVLAVPIQALVTRDPPPSAGSSPAGPGTDASTPTARGAAQEGVYRKEEGKAHFVPIKTGLTGSLEVEVTEGLKEGDEIIVGPFRALRELKDGEAVRPIPAAGAEGAPGARSRR